ncbi:hypothetical protein ACFC6U_04600, partial [Kitasatospora purpeofusca]
PADHYRLAERRQHDGQPALPLPGSAVAPADPPADAPGAPTGGLQPPLPQRVRQASLAAELRVPPPPRTPYPGTGAGFGSGFGNATGNTSGGAPGSGPAEGPFQRPPRRSGATVGAFQRQSRAARGLGAAEDLPPAGGPAVGALPPGRGTTPPSGPASPTAPGTPTPAPGPSPWALPAADPRTTRTEEQS